MKFQPGNLCTLQLLNIGSLYTFAHIYNVVKTYRIILAHTATIQQYAYRTRYTHVIYIHKHTHKVYVRRKHMHTLDMLTPFVHTLQLIHIQAHIDTQTHTHSHTHDYT